MPKQTVTEILQERQSTHGTFSEASNTIQRIKAIMRASPNWDQLSNAQREALEMMQSKVGRILHGDPQEPDHWADIQGYTKLGEPNE